MMATPEENERAFRAAEDAEIARKRAEDEDLERRYRKENSGLGFRRNQQDNIIFARGKCWLILAVDHPLSDRGY
jgi:hypothetical protein